MNLGEIHNEPVDVYHATDAVSNSKLAVFRRSPRLYYERFIEKSLPREEPGKPLIIGSALHAYLLEGPPAFSRSFITIPEDAPKRPTRAQWNAKKPSPETLDAIAFWSAIQAEAERDGKEIVSQADRAQIEKLLAAVARNAFACALLTDPATRCEVTFRKAYKHFAVQCRADAVNHVGNEASDGKPFVVDLKTTESLFDDDFATFGKSFVSYGYHRQAELYREVIAEVLGIPPEGQRHAFYFVAVEKEPPHACQVYPVSAQALEIAREELFANPSGLLVRLHQCYASGEWPLPADVGEPLALPDYYVNRQLRKANAA